MTKHTPTPWEIYCDIQGTHIGFSDELGFGDICHMRDRLEVDHANAAFIVRACNNFEGMLEALELALKFCEDITMDRPSINPMSTIAKAIIDAKGYHAGIIHEPKP